MPGSGLLDGMFLVLTGTFTQYTAQHPRLLQNKTRILPFFVCRTHRTARRVHVLRQRLDILPVYRSVYHGLAKRKRGSTSPTEINFPKKASPGRGKLSPQVTDEGADKQQFTENYPSFVCSLRSQPPSPQGVKAFAPNQASNVDFRGRCAPSFTFLRFRGILTGKPAGYPTPVGERGRTMRSGASGTQKMEGTGCCSAIIGDAEPYIE